mmetsp:Transcript_26588/g.57766  ORF Transcript_26588/g.57766 Transcript_26588/m.57766 type:complete len:299 (+) Transcript_26588:319-1215(+)
MRQLAVYQKEAARRLEAATRRLPGALHSQAAACLGLAPNSLAAVPLGDRRHPAEEDDAHSEEEDVHSSLVEGGPASHSQEGGPNDLVVVLGASLLAVGRWDQGGLRREDRRLHLHRRRRRLLQVLRVEDQANLLEVPVANRLEEAPFHEAGVHACLEEGPCHGSAASCQEEDPSCLAEATCHVVVVVDLREVRGGAGSLAVEGGGGGALLVHLVLLASLPAVLAREVLDEEAGHSSEGVRHHQEGHCCRCCYCCCCCCYCWCSRCCSHCCCCRNLEVGHLLFDRAVGFLRSRHASLLH